MTITREQVRDLQPGDVVELHMSGWREGVTLRGPLHESSPGTLWLADVQIRHHDGDVYGWSMRGSSTLNVVSRAPRPLYVNHPRTEPASGDVVHIEGDESWRSFGWSGHDWILVGGSIDYSTEDLIRQGGLRLLVDGETGQVVQ